MAAGPSNRTRGSLVCSVAAGLVLHFLMDVRKFVKVRKRMCAYYRKRRREKQA